ncbi:serine hydrolase domain-containing protein [Microbacterium sp. PM5]|uniref:serine hydrolase domain-containing protein n=1 Tax=Microbacterium sp. PM5 TaxID=2014534 RepID=UPI000DD0F7EA|nr:serine hydrolase domain-containing protein [Microbacterium sp. PM5]AXA96467.1 serine hydrolase [Microbacterium sp. PM5]
MNVTASAPEDAAAPRASARRRAVEDAARYAARWFAFAGAQRQVPGIQAAIRLDGELVLDFAWGVADAATGAALTGEHLFRIASHSKTFTATAVLQLADRGDLRLDDTIAGWIPELVDTELASVTLRELLAHQGGVVRDGRDADYWQRGGPFPDRARLVEICRAEGRVFARNEFFKYSNIAYGLLGLVVEAASGVDYDEFTRAHICAPLGLERSGSEWQAAREAEYAAGHTARLADGERRVIGHVDTRALAAATGWFSTAAETTAYLSAHRLGDERLVSDDAKRQAQHPHSRIDIGGALRDYGLGFELHTLGGRRLVGHSGGYPGHITRTWLDPDEGVSVSVFTNAIDGPADLLATGAMALIHLALSHADDEERAELPEERFASLWSVLDIAHLGGATFALHPVADDPTRGAERVEIAADGTLHQSRRDGFGATGEPVEVARAADGAVESISWSGMTMWPHAVFTEAMALPDPGAVLERMSL